MRTTLLPLPINLLGFVFSTYFLFPSFIYAKNLEIVNPYAMLQFNKKAKVHSELLKRNPNKLSEKKHSLPPTKTEHKSSELILINAIAKDGKSSILLKNLLDLGLKDYSVYGRYISGFLPGKVVNKLESLKSLNEIKPSEIFYSQQSQGSVVSKGDRSQQSDLARNNFKVTGKKIKIGIMSDSFNCLKGAKTDKQTNDLPENFVVIEEAHDCYGATDEGRALMQIVHDIAPSSQLFFFSSSNGLAKTANGILDLAFKYKVDIIVDDYKSLSANFFQKDPVSKAVDRVVKAGVTYITAAGNSGRNAYQSSYNEIIDQAFQLNAHDFDPGPGVDIYQKLTVPEGVGFQLALQWEEPAYSISGSPGSQTDLDIFIFNKNHTKILASSTFGNIGRDPMEVIRFFNPPDSGETNFDLMITKASGKSPRSFKYIILNSIEGIIAEYQTNSSAIFGHANSPSAITVGACNYLDTPVFGTTSPILRSYSSAGGTSLAFDLNGELINNPSTPQKPDVIAPDNVNTTFFGNVDTDNDGKPNISGSSAAAPHAAGVAALLLERNPQLQPKDIKQILQSTAVDIILRNHEDGTKTALKNGFDFDSGYGLINAEAAVDLAKNFQASPPQEPDNSNNGEITVNDINQNGGGGLFNIFYLFVLLIFALNRRLANAWNN